MSGDSALRPVPYILRSLRWYSLLSQLDDCRTSAALVRHSGSALGAILDELGGRHDPWLKGDRVSVRSGLWIRALGPNFKKIVDEGNWGKWLTPGTKPLKGTVGWTHFACELDVPLDTQCIVSGMIHNGTGTMWMDDFKFEVIDAGG